MERNGLKSLNETAQEIVAARCYNRGKGGCVLTKEIPYKKTILVVFSMIAILLLVGLMNDLFAFQKSSKATQRIGKQDVRTAQVVANGDILLHDVLYTSAEKPDGSYDFTPYFEFVKERISKADLAIGDFEGTISPDDPLAGYPLFNAPPTIANAMKATGYDVVDLAHNHILDSGLAGALHTKKTFEKLGLSTVGIYEKNRETEDFLIKKVNGINIAILGYSYGYNGMEGNLTEDEYQKHLSDFNQDKMKTDIQKAKEKADVTIVMPQSGTEYALEPTEEQKTLYRSMIDWGADVVLGGHPHVVEPAEVITKNHEKKLIIYSMGNFISNQRYETLGDIWTERGLLMDITFEKKDKKTIIKTVKAHPTIVLAKAKSTFAKEGYELYNYRTLVLTDFIEGGKYRNQIDLETQQKVDIAYKEMGQHVQLNWK